MYNVSFNIIGLNVIHLYLVIIGTLTYIEHNIKFYTKFIIVLIAIRYNSWKFTIFEANKLLLLKAFTTIVNYIPSLIDSRIIGWSNDFSSTPMLSPTYRAFDVH